MKVFFFVEASSAAVIYLLLLEAALLKNVNPLLPRCHLATCGIIINITCPGLLLARVQFSKNSSTSVDVFSVCY